MSSEFYIYLAMGCLFALALLSPWGVLRQLCVSFELQRAAKKLSDRTAAGQLSKQILAGQTDEADTLFHDKALGHQLRLYCEDTAALVSTDGDKRRFDIEDYFHPDLLDELGNTRMCEHICSSMTALGILGTFIGLQNGIAHFKPGDLDAIEHSITRLIDGMSVAFETSIVGIILSLLLGILMHLVRSHSQKQLDSFTDFFHSNVLSDQSPAAINQLLEHVCSMERRLQVDSSVQAQMLSSVADRFARELTAQLKEQTDELRAALTESARQQTACAAAIQEMSLGLSTAGEQIRQTGAAFAAIAAQSVTLDRSIASASTSLTRGMTHLEQMLQANLAVTESQQTNADRLFGSFEALHLLMDQVENQALSAEAIVSASAQSCHNAADAARDGYREQLDAIAAIYRDLQGKLHEQSKKDLEYLRTAALMIIQDMPAALSDNAKINALIEQNALLLEYQREMIQLLRAQQKFQPEVSDRRHSP